MDKPLFTIRPARKGDIRAVVALEQKSFDYDCFSKRQFDYLFHKANSYFFVACINDKPVAYLILLKRKNSRRLRIYSLAVDVDSRGFSIAAELLRHANKVALESGCNLLSLEVSEGNKPAINLYLKAGFTVTGRKPGYYTDGSDALLMEKSI